VIGFARCASSRGRSAFLREPLRQAGVDREADRFDDRGGKAPMGAMRYVDPARRPAGGRYGSDDHLAHGIQKIAPAWRGRSKPAASARANSLSACSRTGPHVCRAHRPVHVRGPGERLRAERGTSCRSRCRSSAWRSTLVRSRWANGRTKRVVGLVDGRGIVRDPTITAEGDSSRARAAKLAISRPRPVAS